MSFDDAMMDYCANSKLVNKNDVNSTAYRSDLPKPYYGNSKPIGVYSKRKEESANFYAEYAAMMKNSG